ncbi:MAG: hypothetical protein WD072_06115 [Pirellulales bacterium]
MNLLLEFFCRFGWGMAAGLVLTPATLVPAGFFRVNLLVVLGLATGAAVIASGLPADVSADVTAGWAAAGWATAGWATAGWATAGWATAGWATAGWAAALAAVVAWVGSVAWLGERVGAGRLLCVATAVLLAAATVLATGGGSDGTGSRWLLGGAALVSGLVSGLAVHAMLLGHWYLNAPGMRVDALRRMIDLALAAWGVQAVVSLAGLALGESPPGTTAQALVVLRWLAGIVGLPILLVMARKTLDIPNTQSATGILYVACLAAILGELTSQLLQAAT